MSRPVAKCRYQVWLGRKRPIVTTTITANTVDSLLVTRHTTLFYVYFPFTDEETSAEEGKQGER